MLLFSFVYGTTLEKSYNSDTKNSVQNLNLVW